MKVEANKQPARVPPDDFERLVALAEELHYAYDVVRRRLEGYRMAQVLIGTFVLVIFILRYAFSAFEETFLIVFFGTVAMSIAYIAMIEVIMSRIKRRSHADRVALRNILALIRETEAAVAKSESWSALDRARLQIRLSRLELDAHF